LLIHFLGQLPGLGLALVADVVVPEAEQGCTEAGALVSNICPGRGINLEPWQSNGHEFLFITLMASSLPLYPELLVDDDRPESPFAWMTCELLPLDYIAPYSVECKNLTILCLAKYVEFFILTYHGKRHFL